MNLVLTILTGFSSSLYMGEEETLQNMSNHTHIITDIKLGYCLFHILYLFS